MDIHERTTKWSKGISEMDVLSLAEKEIVCNKVAKQLFAICVTVVTLILIAIIASMFEYPWLLDYMTNTSNTVNQDLSTAHSQAGRAGGTIASLTHMLLVLAVMLIPTMVVFYIIKKPLLKRETRNIIGSEQLRSNEHIVDINDLDEEKRIDGVFHTDIKVELSAENRRYFTNVELLRKIHNQIANKIEEGQDCFEGLEYVEIVERIPVYRVMIGD